MGSREDSKTHPKTVKDTLKNNKYVYKASSAKNKAVDVGKRHAGKGKMQLTGTGNSAVTRSVSRQGYQGQENALPMLPLTG